MVPALPPGSVLAVGWASVELDRAAEELAPLLVPGSTFRRTQASIHLGAYAWIGSVEPGRLPPDAPATDRVVLLEPSTEGRLAVTLARLGEGWCATWVAAVTVSPRAPGEAAPPRSLLRPGPVGDERLLLDGPAWGPHRLVVERATIRP
jgi:hypothetical protein